MASSETPPLDERVSSVGTSGDTSGSSTTTTTNVKEKILRRAELGRITRMLKSRLEIAQFKVGRSWQNLPFKSVEPQLEREVKLRHPEAFDDLDLHDPLHIEPEQQQQNHQHQQSQKDNLFVVPNLPSRGRGHDPSTVANSSTTRSATPSGGKYAPMCDSDTLPRHGISPLKRHRSPSPESGDSPDLGSSPLKYRASSGNMRERHHHHDPRSPNGHLSTPPPSTPPPSHLRTRLNNHQHHHSHAGHGSSKADTEEGADLLLYLATSPSPAKGRRTHRTSAALDLSSPPAAPMRASSAVNTPVGAGFNLSEFLNFSPSPAQVSRNGRFDVNKFSPAKLTYDDSPARGLPRHLEGM